MDFIEYLALIKVKLAEAPDKEEFKRLLTRLRDTCNETLKRIEL